MSIASDIIRGHIDTIILSCLSAEDSYGYKISKSIIQKTGGGYEIKEATLYTAFKRLEAAELIASYWGDELSGARRRYYKITAKGAVAFQKQKAEWAEAKQMLDKLINTEEK